jgi:hypothetical protein
MNAIEERDYETALQKIQTLETRINIQSESSSKFYSQVIQISRGDKDWETIDVQNNGALRLIKELRQKLENTNINLNE